MVTEKSKRTRVIPVRVTEEMYQQLADIADGYDLPVSLYCYLAVRKAVAFQHEVMHVSEDDILQSFIP